MKKLLDTKAFLSQALAVSVLQWLTLLAPLVTMPLLTRALGLEGYGKLALCVAITSYLTIWIDFGFRWSATREVARAETPQLKSQIFWEVQCAKLLLAFAAMGPLISLTFIVAGEELKTLIISSAILSAAGTIFYPYWFLEGESRTITTSSYQLIARIIQSIIVITFIHTKKDLIIAVIAEFSVNIICGLLSLRVYMNNGNPKVIQLRNINAHLKKAFPLFFSGLASSLYSTINPILIGYFGTAEIVGLYATADKVVQSVKRLINPLCTISYTRFIKLTHSASPSLQRETSLLTCIYVIWGLLSMVLLFLFSTKITLFVGGESFIEASSLIKIMCPIPLLSVLGYIAGYHVLIPRNREDLLLKIVTTGSFISIFITIAFVQSGTAAGVAYSALINQAGITLATCYIAIRTHQNEKLCT